MDIQSFQNKIEIEANPKEINPLPNKGEILNKQNFAKNV
jgi:hypothetical protein